MFSLFERLLKPTLSRNAEPPAGLVAFYWHFARQAKGLFAALFVAGFIVALLDSTIPVFMGRIVTLVTSSQPETLFATDHWPLLLGMAVVLLVLRPLALTAQNLVSNQAIAANVANMIRWQNHWHVVRQSWAFFQNDFAGRIANRVMQTGPAIRESLVALITGVWYILVYGTSALILLASADRWLALPIVLWFAGYLVMLRIFVPRMRDRSKEVSEARSLAHRPHRRQLHQHPHGEAVRARPRRGRLCARGDRRAHRPVLRLAAAQHAVRLLPVDAQRHAGDRHRRHRDLCCGRTARSRSAPWRWRCRWPGRSSTSPAGWPWQVTDIFENIGVVQEGMMTIARPIALTDRPTRRALTVTRGEIAFEDVRFGYGREAGVIDGPRRSTVAAGREDRPGRPLRRRQVDRWSICCCASSISRAAAS